jgi:hypothetical protein
MTDLPSTAHEILLPIQHEIRALSREIPSVLGDVPSATDPAALHEQLRASSIGDLLLQPGDTLWALHDRGQILDTFTPGEDGTLRSVAAVAYGVNAPKERVITAPQHAALASTAHTRPLGDGTYALHYPGEQDWRGYVGLAFWYDRNHDGVHFGGPVGELLKVHTNHRHAGRLPTLMQQMAIRRTKDAPGEFTAYPTAERRVRSEDEGRILLGAVRQVLANARQG